MDSVRLHDSQARLADKTHGQDSRAILEGRTNTGAMWADLRQEHACTTTHPQARAHSLTHSLTHSLAHTRACTDTNAPQPSSCVLTIATRLHQQPKTPATNTHTQAHTRTSPHPQAHTHTQTHPHTHTHDTRARTLPTPTPFPHAHTQTHTPMYAPMILPLLSRMSGMSGVARGNKMPLGPAQAHQSFIILLVCGGPPLPHTRGYRMCELSPPPCN
jgi:hypothetical protein